MNIVIFTITAILFAFVAVNWAQGSLKIPEAQLFNMQYERRENFVGEFKRLVKYQTSEKWDKMYTFLYDPKNTKEDYVADLTKVKLSRKLVFFNVTNIHSLEPDEDHYLVRGCAIWENRESKRTESFESDTEIRFIGGKWFINPIAITTMETIKPCDAQG